MFDTDFLAILARHWGWLMLGDTFYYTLFALAFWALFWVLLAKPLAARRLRSERPPPGQLRREFFFSLRSIAVFSTLMLIPWIAFQAGWWNAPRVGAKWGPLWFWFSLALMIVAHDAYFYWAHRLSHHRLLFSRIHRRHHRSHNPSPFTAYSFDWGEAVLMGSFVPIWVLLVPTPWGAVDLFALHLIVRNTLLHSGLEIMPARRDGRPLFGWLTATLHHDLHHARPGWNFGLYFTWWDRWMGTEHPRYLELFAQAAQRRAERRSPTGPAYST